MPGTAGPSGAKPPVNYEELKRDMKLAQDKFHQAFEKPTQIYKYLRNRTLHKPSFLQRNLTYMKHRMSRSHKSRQNFKIDEMKEKREKTEEELKKNKKGQIETKFYNIIVVGFSGGRQWAAGSVGKAEIKIIRICQKKRKETTIPITCPFSKEAQVRTYNDLSSIDPKSQCSVLALPSEAINISNGHVVQAYVMRVTVVIPKSACCEVSYQNGGSTSPSSSSSKNDDEEHIEEPRPKRRRIVHESPESDFVFSGEFTIYDQALGISIGNTDFEVLLKPSRAKRATFDRFKKPDSSWKISDSNNFTHASFNGDSSRAILKLAIRTATSKIDFIEPPTPLPITSDPNGKQVVVPQEMRVIYQFIFNNSRQQTEARNDLSCPWCNLNCKFIYSLLKHLKLCHNRLNFIYVPTHEDTEARIDVSLNTAFDGSYSGSAYDLIAQPPGEAFARNGPTKRTSIFSVLVCRPKRHINSLNEFLEDDEKDGDLRRAYMTGHNRLYHHTTTCLPINPKEIDVDSEGETDPEWLRQKTSMMIDEFSDVNEGEKEVMKMWNIHMMRNNYVGDCQIPLACAKFVEEQGKELIRKNLYRNFVIHLTSLHDFGLLSPHGLYTTVQKLLSQMRDTGGVSGLREVWKAQMAPSSFSFPIKDEPNNFELSQPSSTTGRGSSNNNNGSPAILTAFHSAHKSNNNNSKVIHESQSK